MPSGSTGWQQQAAQQQQGGVDSEQVQQQGVWRQHSSNSPRSREQQLTLHEHLLAVQT
jgi:hypothetical protein